MKKIIHLSDLHTGYSDTNMGTGKK